MISSFDKYSRTILISPTVSNLTPLRLFLVVVPSILKVTLWRFVQSHHCPINLIILSFVPCSFSCRAELLRRLTSALTPTTASSPSLCRMLIGQPYRLIWNAALLSCVLLGILTCEHGYPMSKNSAPFASMGHLTSGWRARSGVSGVRIDFGLASHLSHDTTEGELEIYR